MSSLDRLGQDRRSAAIASGVIDLYGAAVQVLTTSGAAAFSLTGQADGRHQTVMIRVQASGANITPSFPAGWVWSTATPVSLTDGNEAVLTITSHGSTDAEVIAGWVEVA